MATALLNTTRSSNSNLYNHLSILPSFSPRSHIRRQNIVFLVVTPRRLRRLAGVGRPPSPPSPDPPPPENTNQLEGSTLVSHLTAAFVLVWLGDSVGWFDAYVGFTLTICVLNRYVCVCVL